jgi:hypothetical protein
MPLRWLRVVCNVGTVRTLICWVSTLAMSLGILSAAASSSQVTVPFVGYPADGQLGPLEPPSGDALPLPFDTPEANRLTYYRAAEGGGVFAPRGWHCRASYGSNGWSLLVTPEAINSPQVTGPMVMAALTNGSTSGRFNVAQAVSRDRRNTFS